MSNLQRQRLSMNIEPRQLPSEIQDYDDNIPKIESFSSSSPVNNFMDKNFKSRTTAPSMLLGLRTKKNAERELAEYSKGMLAI